MSETVIYVRRENDERRYDLPHHEGVAIMFVESNGPPTLHERDVVKYIHVIFLFLFSMIITSWISGIDDRENRN